jgi:hypothetical protein
MKPYKVFFSAVKHIPTAVILLVFYSCSSNTKKLEDKVQSARFHYIAWACDCANWATGSDIYKYQDQGDKLADHSVFIEPADIALTLPDTICYNGDIILLTGQYYIEKGFPKNYRPEQPADKAKVFRYTAYKIIKSNYREAITSAHD